MSRGARLSPTSRRGLTEWCEGEYRRFWVTGRCRSGAAKGQLLFLAAGQNEKSLYPWLVLVSKRQCAAVTMVDGPMTLAEQ